MAQQYLMAVDAGTGSVRAVLFDTDGNQVGVSQQEWFHREDPRWPGSMDFDWKHNWDLASGCIRDVLRDTGVDPAEIAAVSTTCMREGIVLYDDQGQEIWACANVDSRSNDEVAQLVRENPDLEKEIYRKYTKKKDFRGVSDFAYRPRDGLPAVFLILLTAATT